MKFLMTRRRKLPQISEEYDIDSTPYSRKRIHTIVLVAFASISGDSAFQLAQKIDTRSFNFINKNKSETIALYRHC